MEHNNIFILIIWNNYMSVIWGDTCYVPNTGAQKYFPNISICWNIDDFPHSDFKLAIVLQVALS